MSWLSETHGTTFELTRHFLVRMFDGEWSSVGGQWQRVAISALALFLPAGMLLVREGSTDPQYAARYRLLSALETPDAFRCAALADQLALLTLVLAVTGLLALLEWQSLFPSARDYLALAGWPVRSREIFAARFGAVLLFSTGLVTAMNLLPSLIAPIEFAGRWQKNPSYLVNLIAEAGACGLGCFFMLFAIIALQGVLLNILPGRWFTGASVLVQGALAGALLLAGFYSWSIQEWSAEDIARLSAFGAWAPPVWFAGLHEVLLGDRDPFFVAMAQRALTASALAMFLAVASYVVSYRRYRTLMIESPVQLAPLQRRHRSPLSLLARTPRQQALMDFMTGTMARSRAHRMIWLIYIGATAAVLLNSSLLNGRAFGHWTGWRHALQFVVLFWPLAASVSLMNGIHHVASIPSELRANWLFQITESQGRTEWMQSVERFILGYTLIPMYLVNVPLAVYLLGWPLALRMTSLQALVSLTVFEWRFYSWQQLPFACSYLPGKSSLIGVLAGYIGVLGAVVPVIAIFISTASRFEPLFAILLAAFTGVWIWARHLRREGWGEAKILYEDRPQTVPDLGIKELTYVGAEDKFRRVTAGDAGHAGFADTDSRADAWLCGGGVHTADVGGCAAGGGRSALPCPAPAGIARTAGGGVGRIGEQPPGEVLPADRRGPTAPGRRDGALEAPRRRDWTHFGTCIAEGEFGEFAATLYRKLHALVRRRDLDRELDEELQFHLSMRAEQYRHEGGAGSSAETAARRRFGNLGRVQEQCRDQWTFVWLETMWQDLRYGVRQLRRSPGFTVSATVTLMLGIGATTAVYSMLHTVLWRPVPLPDLGSLVFIMQASPGEGMPFRPTSPADLDDIRSRVTTVRDLAAWQITRSNIVDSGGEPMVVESARVSPNLFSMLGIRPALGRVFRPEEDQRGKEQVVLLSDSLWRRHFGGDANIVGRTVRIEGRDFTVVGVMPPEFRFPRSWRDMWIPLALTPDEQASRNGSRLEVGARLQPGRSRAQVTAELDGIAAALEKQYPETNRNRRFLALSFERYWYGDLAPIFASLILGGSLFVLLIACANVANLQFARATTRVRELAVRTALGSGLWRQVRQLLTESVGLAALGGALGLVVAWVELGLLKAAVPAEMRHYMAWDEIGINARALAFALAATVASGILAGLAPAWRCRRIDLVESLKEGGHGSSAGPKGTRWRSILAAGEIAAATVLLVGSVLMVHGFRGLVSASSSAEPASMLTMQLALDATRYREPHQVSAFYRELVARAAAIPGVRTAAAASGLPYSRRYPSGQFAIQGRQFEPGQKPSALIEAVTPDYFRALLVPLRTGRLPTDADRPGTTPVAVISQRAADRWWPGRQPIGDQIRLGERDWVTIVGVVGDLSYSVLNREPGPVVYVPFAQMPDRSMNVGLRVAGDPMRVAPAVRSLVRSLDPELPVTNLSTLDVLIRQESYGLEFMASFMGVSGLLALILSVVGLYGVTAYSTSARTHETGIRMALGARRRQVIMRLFGRGMVSVISGLGLGLIPAWGLARLMQSVVWGVRADDPAAFVGVPAVLIGVAALAVLVPALRATRIDPVKALRHD